MHAEDPGAAGQCGDIRTQRAVKARCRIFHTRDLADEPLARGTDQHRISPGHEVRKGAEHGERMVAAFGETESGIHGDRLLLNARETRDLELSAKLEQDVAHDVAVL